MPSSRWARSFAAALLFPFAGATCRDVTGTTGLGRIAPTAAALAFSSTMPAGSGEPLITIEAARIRLFRLPGEVPERAVIDTTLPFRETDSTRTFSTSLTLTMVSERFGVELSLLDDHGQIVYLARDTVTAYANSAPTAIKPLLLRYAGPDTAVTRITLAPRDTSLSVGDAITLRTGAFLRSGAPTTARFGFAVHGAAGITVDAEGVVRAVGAVPARSTWVVARLATGLSDSVAIGAVSTVRSMALRPQTARVAVRSTFAFAATALDAAGDTLHGRSESWRSSDVNVATVVGGVARGVSAGTATITVESEGAAASAVLIVESIPVARVVPNASLLSLHAGETAMVTAVAQDAAGAPIDDAMAVWTSEDPSIASVSSVGVLATSPIVVRAIAEGSTRLNVVVDGLRAMVDVFVAPALAAHVTIAPALPLLLVGDRFPLAATVRDGAGAVQPNRVVAWRSLDPTIATVDEKGNVQGTGLGRTGIIASVDAVADTMGASIARASELVVTSLQRKLVFPGSTDVSVAALDAAGKVIGAPWASWAITGPGTLSASEGTTVHVTASAKGSLVVTATAGGLVASVQIESGVSVPDAIPQQTE